MLNRAARTPDNGGRRRFPVPLTVVAGAAAALFVATGGSAAAAKSLINAADLARGAVTSEAIKDGAIKPTDLSRSTKKALHGAAGVTGAKGDTGSTGGAGAAGLSGTPGANGANGPNGAAGAAGSNGANGPNGIDGTDGTNGTNGTDGIDGTVTPLSAPGGSTPLPTTSPPTVVVTLTVPAGKYVVLAKTQLTHTGAGDTIDCVLRAGTTPIDQVSMKTLPALAAIPVSLQAVTETTSPTPLNVTCDVAVANGTADFSSVIAIPTG